MRRFRHVKHPVLVLFLDTFEGLATLGLGEIASLSLGDSCGSSSEGMVSDRWAVSYSQVRRVSSGLQASDSACEGTLKLAVEHPIAQVTTVHGGRKRSSEYVSRLVACLSGE